MKKNDTIKRIKFISTQTKGYMKMVGRMIKDVMNPAIKSKEQVLEMLNTTASVEDFFKILDELHNRVMPSLEADVDYKRYDTSNGPTIIYFFDDDADCLTKEEIDKVCELFKNEICSVIHTSTLAEPRRCPTSVKRNFIPSHRSYISSY